MLVLATGETTVPLTDFYDYVLPDLPGCPIPLALTQIRRAAIEFFRDSEVLQMDIAAIDLVAEQATYTINPGTNFEAIDFDSVVVEDVPLDPASPRDLDRLLPGWREGTSGTPSHFFSESGLCKSITLARTPSASVTGGLEIRVLVNLLETATTLPAAAFKKYREGIARNARARLMLSPKKPYTDAALGAVLMAQAYQDAIEARNQREAGHARAPARTRPVPGLR